MVCTDWADLNRDGRRMDIIKQMYKKSKLQTETSLELAYIDRAIKATNTKTNIAEIVLNIKRTLKEVQKVAPVPVLNV